MCIKATLKAAGGQTIGPVAVPFLWHPGLYHHGVSVKVPGSGRYTVTVQITAPTFCRHDKANGNRYGRDLEVVFEDVQV